MCWIIVQYFFMLILMITICSYPLIGIAEYFHSKIKRDIVWIIGALLMVTIMLASILSIIILDKENLLLWYVLTVLTIVFSSVTLLNASQKTTKILEPKTPKEYISNAKLEYFEDKTIKFILKLRLLIYPIYILLTMLNQLQTLRILSFSSAFSLYLQVNEYSLIILFSVNEMIKFFMTAKKGNNHEI